MQQDKEYKHSVKKCNGKLYFDKFWKIYKCNKCFIVPVPKLKDYYDWVEDVPEEGETIMKELIKKIIKLRKYIDIKIFENEDEELKDILENMNYCLDDVFIRALEASVKFNRIKRELGYKNETR